MTTTDTGLDERARSLHAWDARIRLLTDYDAAREELAKTRAELDGLKALLEQIGPITIKRGRETEHGPMHYGPELALLANPATTAKPAIDDRCGEAGPDGAKCTRMIGHLHAGRRHRGVDADGEERWWSTTAEPADEPKATCGATGPDLPFIACTYPAGHPPIPIDVRGVGMRDMDHGNDREYRTWWNGRTALVHGDALAQQNRMVSAENAAIVLDEAEPAAS